MSDYLLDEFVTPQAGNAYRLFPFGVIYKGGKKREITREYAALFRLPHFKPPIKLGSHKEETPAGGHISRLEVREDGLYAVPEWVESGRTAMLEGAYRYQSPEVIFEGGLEDPQTGNLIPAPLIIGDALLHTPHLGEATALYSVEPKKGEEPMTTENVSIPASLWEKFMAMFEKSQTQTPPPETPQEPENYTALVTKVDEYAAKIEALETEKAQREQFRTIAGNFATEEFGAAFKSLQTDTNVEVLATMTQAQRDWTLTQFKALSAQIKESELTGKQGKHTQTDADPVEAFNAAIKAKQAEAKVDYNTAFDLVRTEQPDVFKAYLEGR